ncbi:alpha/beta hydrolase-fold protein [Breoghania sp.]|uniref:alpha/beta hydrolase family esterase n=1 Tax=Breoghania sp. TaxID=2065378 RepID=UPI002AA6AEBB|nr:alpha/beta hydrolase-fold protein [Breoghania sp.]
MTARSLSIAGGFRFVFRGFLGGAGFAALLLGLSPAGVAEPSKQSPGACGVETACPVPGGEYRVRMPDSAKTSGRIGAILYLHGYRGTAENAIRNKGLVRMASDLGVALITPQGAGRSWSFPGSPQARRDDIAFIGAVLDDAARRLPIDPDKVMASGFSVGGSMVWYLACNLGDRFAGFAPVAGAFWEPLPQSCPGPEPNLFHVHGTSDKVVPMAGRAIGDRARQGDVIEGWKLWETKGACAGEVPESFSLERLGLDCERRARCNGKTLELCLHPGGHAFKAVWVERAWRELAALKGWQVPARIE